MQTFKRLCIRDYTITDDHGHSFTVKRGHEYLTSAVDAAPSIGPAPEEGCVIVFSHYWAPVPVEVFAGEIEFTKAD